MYYPKQHYESIVPAKKALIDLVHHMTLTLFPSRLLLRSWSLPIFLLTHFPTMKLSSNKIARWCQCRRIVVDVILTAGRSSVDQKAIVLGVGNYYSIFPAWLTNEFPRIHHMMHWHTIFTECPTSSRGAVTLETIVKVRTATVVLARLAGAPTNVCNITNPC